MARRMPLCRARGSGDVRSARSWRADSTRSGPMQQASTAVTKTRCPHAGRALAVDVRDVSLTFETADGTVEALSEVDLQVAAGDSSRSSARPAAARPRCCAYRRSRAADRRHVAGQRRDAGGGAAAAPLRLHLPGAGALSVAHHRAQRDAAARGHGLFAPSERRERARRYLELVNLSGFERKFPWQLSGGMQQRASIARALSFDPALLLMDEPFGALDEIVRDHLNEQLLRLWDQTGKTVRVRHPFDPRGGVPLDQDRGDVAAARAASSTSSTATFRATARSKSARRRNSSKIAQRVRMGLRAGHSYDE